MTEDQVADIVRRIMGEAAWAPGLSEAITLTTALVLGVLLWSALRRASRAEEAAVAATETANVTAETARAAAAKADRERAEMRSALRRLEAAAVRRVPDVRGSRPRSGISRPAAGPAKRPKPRPLPVAPPEVESVRTDIRLATDAVQGVVRGPKRAGNRAGFFPPSATTELDIVAHRLERVLKAPAKLPPEQTQEISASVSELKRARASLPAPGAKHTHMPQMPCPKCDTADALLSNVRNRLSKSLSELGAGSD